MTLEKRIFNARISGQPLKIEWGFLRTRFVNQLLKYKVIKVDISQPGNLGNGELVFRLNDSISTNGFEYSIGQRILFSNLNINGIVQVA